MSTTDPPTRATQMAQPPNSMAASKALMGRIAGALDRLEHHLGAPAPLGPPAPEQEALKTLDQKCQAVKQTSETLQTQLRTLREAQMQSMGAAAAERINSTLAAELDALRALREVEKAEVEAILATLRQLLGVQKATLPPPAKEA